ncbi:cyclic nucleotide-binding domain-containing protein [Methylocella sp. CPCC 101449]|uniref:Crp/Fnr family transcriptional regulator n=1 Tax=Methylocella sp. CPCC 101449 TaxID=2987531 RepID=UPI00288EB306|nr:cyclic nucleotide-binding domain-containing protein [Methylocella sp. CPCC 101449]MDT2024524.1 cyclic nucleotide-binding domain-containing protein [Methylocella sp. CPCC 101449]
MDSVAVACGWAGTALAVAAFWPKTIMPLRWLMVAASLFAIVYFAWERNWPPLGANVLILLLNLWRLQEMRKLIADAEKANREELNFDWLTPHMQAVSFEAGETLFNKGDEADAVYVVAEGQLNLPELGIIIGPGAMIGEMGLFSVGNRRLSGARAMGPVRAYRMAYRDFEQHYFQNPQFGLYLVRLMVRRLESNLSRYSGGKAGPVAAAAPPGLNS